MSSSASHSHQSPVCGWGAWTSITEHAWSSPRHITDISCVSLDVRKCWRGWTNLLQFCKNLRLKTLKFCILVNIYWRLTSAHLLSASWTANRTTEMCTNQQMRTKQTNRNYSANTITKQNTEWHRVTQTQHSAFLFHKQHYLLTSSLKLVLHSEIIRDV